MVPICVMQEFAKHFALELSELLTLEAALFGTPMAAVAVLLALLVAAVPAASATDYTVGDLQGWASGVDYDAWASSKAFKMGDALLFQFNPLHNVAEVSEADYKACSSGNTIQTYTDQSTKISLTGPGSRYFICGTPGHCSAGMKLAVTVSASAPSSPPSTVPGSPSQTTSPLSPSSDTPSPDNTPTNASGGIRSGGFHGGNALLAVGVAGLALLGLRLVD